MVTAAPRRLTVLGATGSIGVNALDVVAHLGGDAAFRIVALTGGENVDLLAAQARRWRPEIAVIRNPEKLAALRAALAGAGVAAAAGEQALLEAAARPADLCLSAIVGAAGLRPTLAAAAAGADIALANKECLVCAGPAFLAAAAAAGAAVIPVDSEHSAIMQCLAGVDRGAVRKFILTASGGPFRDWPLERMREVTPHQAAAHPNWSMGARISVDSATMFNKGLEVIEAAHLFAARSDEIDVVVHPQSIVHSMVALHDGAVLAHMGAPDMRAPIAYALGWPERPTSPAAALDWTRVGPLTFEAPDPRRFPALRLAREALEVGGVAPAVLNGAKEVGLQAFLDGRVGLLQIAEIVEDVLTAMAPTGAAFDIDDALAADAQSRLLAEGAAARRAA